MSHTIGMSVKWLGRVYTTLRTSSLIRHIDHALTLTYTIRVPAFTPNSVYGFAVASIVGRGFNIAEWQIKSSNRKLLSFDEMYLVSSSQYTPRGQGPCKAAWGMNLLNLLRPRISSRHTLPLVASGYAWTM